MRSLTTTYTMSLLAKRFLHKKFLRPGLILLIPVFLGCDSSEDLGIQYELSTNANVRFIEFTLPATNIYVDSLRTDGAGRILVGNYSDPLTGSVSAEGYLQYEYISGPLPRGTNAEVDSLELDSIIVTLEAASTIPQRGGIFFQEFSLYDLEDSLESIASNVIYLSRLKQNTSTLAASFSQSINTLTDSVYRMKLNEDYATAFFQNLSDIASDPTASISVTEFKSIGLIPGPGSAGISDIILDSDTSRVTVYSSPVDDKDTTYITSFGFTEFNANHYTFLERDRSTSEFAGAAEFENIDLASGETVVDPVAGLTVAFSVEPIADFFENNRSILINSATMSFDFRSEIDRDTLESFMNFFRKNDGGIFGPSTASNPFGNLIMSDNGYVSLRTDPAATLLSEDRSRVLLNATLFYQQVYQEYLERDSLVYQNPLNGDLIPIQELVGISTTNVTLQRTIIENNGIKLRFYYTEVDR